MREYNAAFQAFFTRLAADGITKANTLFLVTVDEGDHYAGGGPLNPGCDGATVACQYDTAEAGGAAFGTAGFQRNVGEADVNLPALVKRRDRRPDDVRARTSTTRRRSSSPTRPTTPATPPGPNDAGVRKLEREMGSLTEFNPINGRDAAIADDLADQTEEGILHMVNTRPGADADVHDVRRPGLLLPDVVRERRRPAGPAERARHDPGPGLPGPGRRASPGTTATSSRRSPRRGRAGSAPASSNLGQTGAIWTDHTDARPTLMSLLGLHDDYDWDGRRDLARSPTGALPAPIAADPADYQALSSRLQAARRAVRARSALATLHYDTARGRDRHAGRRRLPGGDGAAAACQARATRSCRRSAP